MHPKDETKSWNQFFPPIFQLLKERNVPLWDILEFLWKISNNRPILLLVDDIRQPQNEYLVPLLNSLREDYRRKFFPFYSVTNDDYLYKNSSGNMLNNRGFLCVPVYQRPFESIMWPFDELIRRKGEQLDDKDRRFLKRCVSFCNGHMRTLEALYNYLEQLTQLKNLEFAEIVKGTLAKLEALQEVVPEVGAEDAKICILGNRVGCDDSTYSNPHITYQQAISQNYFFNQEVDYIDNFCVPKLTPFSLCWVSVFSGRIIFANSLFFIYCG